jgi:hypothetical protein
VLTVAAVAVKLLIALILLPFKLVTTLASGIFYVGVAVAALALVVVAAALLPILLPLAAVAAITAAILA